MATGSGKTIVMAMLVAWQVLNKVTYPQDRRYSKNIFAVAPGLTVHSRQVTAWVKNDDLGYEIMYVYNGIVKKYRLDFLIRRPKWAAGLP